MARLELGAEVKRLNESAPPSGERLAEIAEKIASEYEPLHPRTSILTVLQREMGGGR